jgi:hypothetical protein
VRLNELFNTGPQPLVVVKHRGDELVDRQRPVMLVHM